MTRPTRRGLVARGSALATAGVVSALAGCGLSPAGTTVFYDPSDGVSAQVGNVQARNLLVVGSDAGQPGVVSGVLLNNSPAPVTVSIAVGDATPVAVQIPADGSAQLGNTGGTPTASPGTKAPTAAAVQFPALPSPAGAIVPLSLSTPQGGTTTVQVPVLAATLEYATLTPSGTRPTSSTPTPTPATSGTATGPSTASPGVTGTAGPTSAQQSSPSKPVTPTSAPTGTASAESTARPS